MIEVDIVTPSRFLVHGAKVESVSLPAARGEVTVLPGHTELVTLLDTGVIRFKENDRERWFAVSYGYAEIARDRVMILAETCEESHDIDLQRALESKRQAEENLGQILTREGFSKYERKIQRALAREQAAQQAQKSRETSRSA